MEQCRVGIRAREFPLHLLAGNRRVDEEAVALTGEHLQECFLVVPIHLDADQSPVGSIGNEVQIDLRNRKRSRQVLRTGIRDLLYERLDESLKNLLRLWHQTRCTPPITFLVFEIHDADADGGLEEALGIGKGDLHTQLFVPTLR